MPPFRARRHDEGSIMAKGRKPAAPGPVASSTASSDLARLAAMARTWSVNPFAIAQIVVREPVFIDSLAALRGFLTKVFHFVDLEDLLDGTPDRPPALAAFSALARALPDPSDLDV